RKYDAAGNELWTSIGGGGLGHRVAVAKNNDGGVGGDQNLTPTPGRGGHHGRAGRLGAGGDVVGAPASPRAAHAPGAAPGPALAPCGNAILAGYQSGVGTGWDGLVQKYDPAGNLMWMDASAAPGKDFEIGVAVHSDDRLVTAGTITLGTDTRIIVRQ